MEKSYQSGPVKIRPLAGVNERVSPIDLPPSEFSEVKGLFPSQDGLLERIWGHKFLTKLDEAILSIYPTYNSKGHIIIQTATKRYLTTLDELFNRNTYTSDLEPATSTPGSEIIEEESMSLAIVIGKKTAGNNGNAIGTAFAARSLTDMPVNEGGTVTSFAANAIKIPAGSYRIETWCCHLGTIADGTQQIFVDRLYNVTNSAYLFQVVGDVSAASTLMRASTGARTNDLISNIWTYHVGTITTTGTIDFEIQSKTNAATANTLEGKATNLGEDEVYTVVKILKTA